MIWAASPRSVCLKDSQLNSWQSVLIHEWAPPQWAMATMGGEHRPDQCQSTTYRATKQNSSSMTTLWWSYRYQYSSETETDNFHTYNNCLIRLGSAARKDRGRGNRLFHAVCSAWRGIIPWHREIGRHVPRASPPPAACCAQCIFICIR